MIGYQLQLFNNFDDFVTFPPPIGDQFVQQDRRKIYSGNVSYMMPSNPFGFDTKNTIGFQTRTDDIHIDLAETTGRVVRYMVRDDHVIESSAGVYFENRVQWADKFRTMTSVPMALAAPTSDSLPLRWCCLGNLPLPGSAPIRRWRDGQRFPLPDERTPSTGFLVLRALGGLVDGIAETADHPLEHRNTGSSCFR